MRKHLRTGVFVACAAAILLAGCGKSSEKKNSKRAEAPAATQPAPNPEYSFADPSIVARHPAAASFISSFLDTCMTGDYLAYRKLVSRYEQPESRERFDKIYKGLRSIVVESVEPLAPEKRTLLNRSTTQPAAGDVFLVISTINFDPKANISLRHRNRKVAILAFEEDGVWRMCPAPAPLQPVDPVVDDATTQPTATQAGEPVPEFPWQEDGDS